jgi:hypothetical protein
VAYESDAISRSRQANRLRVHFRHEWARRVDYSQLAAFRSGPDSRRNAVRREYERLSVRHVAFGLDEDSAFALELGHDVHVVHDLFPDVDRRTEVGERAPYDLNGSVDTCAVPPRRRKQHLLGHTSQSSNARAIVCASAKKSGRAHHSGGSVWWVLP